MEELLNSSFHGNLKLIMYTEKKSKGKEESILKKSVNLSAHTKIKFQMGQKTKYAKKPQIFRTKRIFLRP